MNYILRPVFHLKNKGLFIKQDMFFKITFLSRPNLLDKNTCLCLKISGSL